ncbi:zinc finger protein 687a [Antennarius striatus]|uniref:zinc finger protein 687a n=1 Tax=Antennarius striatus TaxID=241820 RepID=UPI0035B37663
MGDMKTPDFDDLLAAFDIPDIDAKEAIQSSPEDEEQHEVGADADEKEKGSPSFPCPPALHTDPPVVSVIVKNKVLSESFEEKYVCDKTDSPSNSSSSSHSQVKLGNVTPQLGSKMPVVEPQIANGFQGSVPRDQGHSSTQLWPQQSPPRSTVKANEGDSEKQSEAGLVQSTTDVMNSLNPLLYLPSSTDTAQCSSTPPSSYSVSPRSPRNDKTNLFCNPSSPIPQNGTLKAGMKCDIHSDEDDSEPDLGSPLVIQESPECLLPTPNFKQKVRQPDLLESAETTSTISNLPNISPMAPEKPEAQVVEETCPTPASVSSTAPQPPSPQDCFRSVSMDFTSEQKKTHPEHVIEERDSPESPPPSETGLVVPKRSSSPDSAQILGTALNHKDLIQKDELMECDSREEDIPVDTEVVSKQIVGVESNVNEENCGTWTEDPAAASVEASDSPQLHPLKVKIKINSASVTKPVSGVAPKRSVRATNKGVDSSKPSSEHITRSKRELSQQSGMPAMLQEDDCTFKDKTAADTKPNVSPTAVNITKAAALPSVSVSFPRVTASGISFHNLGSKNLDVVLPATSSILHPQSSTKPASIVNSTGAIISKTQTNLVEAFNKILNNRNLLPSYKPDLSSPPAEWGLLLPAQGYRCLECGDAFALEQSLMRHYARRSLRIEVTCNHCAKRLAFFNKCSLLLHAREHKERGLIMQCSHLVMKPVSIEQMIGQQESAAVGPSSSSSSSFIGQTTKNITPQPHKIISKRKREVVLHVRNKCPECQTQFSSKDEVANHFQEIKSAQNTSCTECSPPMLLPNGCSAAAHKRIHQGQSPHVCPECGGQADQPLFQTHLEDKCLHFSRRIGYRCSSCLVVFGGVNSVKSHIQQAHCDMFHKCPSCPMAFKSAPSIQNHITSQHPTLTEGQTMAIYKCVMCDTVFTNKNLLYVHFDTHLTNQKVHVFKCPECPKLFSQRNSLLDHFKTHNKKPTIKQELSSHPATSSCSRLASTEDGSDAEECIVEHVEKKLKTERMTTALGWKCATCYTRHTDREDYISHMAEQHGKTLKKFPCNKCESSFTTTSSLRRHIRDKHKATNRSFFCQLCNKGKKMFSSRVMLERHIQLRHGMDKGVQSTLGGGDEAESSSEQDSGLVARRKRRGAVKLERDDEYQEGLSPVKKLQSSSSSGPGSLQASGFRCAPCGFTAEDQASFLEHISQHRRGAMEGSGQQCLQCGACFTSTSSLARHRFITHKVRNAFTDSQQSLSVRPAPSPGNNRNQEDVTSLDGPTPTSPTSQRTEEEGTLTCKVCRKRFEKASDLNTHFRTHGMAFISARNTGKTT